MSWPSIIGCHPTKRTANVEAGSRTDSGSRQSANHKGAATPKLREKLGPEKNFFLTQVVLHDLLAQHYIFVTRKFMNS